MCYLHNSTLGGYLHRYMMAKWYGEDILKDLTEKGYVVDHLNNNHMDCRITNLEFLKKNRNTAKGQYFDAEASQMRERLAVSLFKDFTTGCYQITIGCNDTIIRVDDDGGKHYINEIKLLYDQDYPLVILDAETILTEYESNGHISLSHLRYCDIREDEAIILELTEEEKNRPFVFRDGVPYLVIGTPNSSHLLIIVQTLVAQFRQLLQIPQNALRYAHKNTQQPDRPIAIRSFRE